MISRDREKPGMLPGFIEHDEQQRVERLREKLAAAVLERLGAAPGETMAYEALCLALRADFFGQLKEGDYSKVVKQLFKDGHVTREKIGIRPKLLPDEKIALAK